MRLAGVHTALVTPFADLPDLAPPVDHDALAALCERQVAAGVQGLVACGTTGETPTLDEEEWAAVIATVVEVVGGRLPVTAGCGTNSTAGTLERVRRARSLGADAALVVLPYYNKPNPEGHRRHVRAVAGAGLPVVLYHVPGRTGQRLGAPILAELLREPGVVALKEATGDMGLASALLRDASVPLLSGDDLTLLPFLALGGAGVVSVVSNVAPRRTVALVEAVARGDLAAAREHHRALEPLVRWLFADTNPVPAKAALAFLGLCSHRVRLPLAEGAPPPPALLEGLA